jgi:hypothetical protein
MNRPDPLLIARDAFRAALPALQAAAALLDAAACAPVAEPPKEEPRYLTRKAWVKLGGERRVFDRAIASREVRAFKPGRELMVRADELFAWVEKHVDAPGQAGEADTSEVVPYERFAAGVRARGKVR